MKRSHRLAIWAAFLFALAGCAHQHESQIDASAELRATGASSSASHQEAHDKVDVHDTRVDAPSHETTSASSDELGVVVQAPDGSVSIARVPKNKPLVVPKGSKVTGSIPLEHNETQRTKDLGGARVDHDEHATHDGTAEAKGASSAALGVTAALTAKDRSSTKWGPPWWVWPLGGAGIVVAGAACWKWRAPIGKLARSIL